MEIQINVRVMVHGKMVLCGIVNQVFVVREWEIWRSSGKEGEIQVDAWLGHDEEAETLEWKNGPGVKKLLL